MERWLSLLFLSASLYCNAQAFWTETFNNGCSSGCSANGFNSGNGAWAVVALAGNAGAGNYPNQWYVSCAENGFVGGQCGNGCSPSSGVATLASLHVGSTSAGDIGAAYDAGGLCGFFYCTNTHRRVQSPNISTVGRTNITLSFDYIETGQGTNDDLYAVQYSINGGTSWVTISNPAKTLCCGACDGSSQGLWTAYTSATLPTTAENITNFRIAFVWTNNDDGLGTDPSFAVDNVKLSTPAVLPVELTEFSHELQSDAVTLNWKTVSEKNFDRFEVQRSEDGNAFYSVGNVKSRGSNGKTENYSFPDKRPDQVTYYRLKMIDKDESYEFSNLIAVPGVNTLSDNENHFINTNGNLEIKRTYVLVNDFKQASILNIEGKEVAVFNLPELSSEKVIEFPIKDLTAGIYLCQLRGTSFQKTFKFLISP
jgi:hypothetical protein